MRKPTIQRLIELQRLLLQFSQVERRNHRKHRQDYIFENDTEHSYNLAMTAWFLAKWFPKLNRDKIIRYALAHDFVEVHAGDTFVYGSQQELASKAQREADAIKKLSKDWADFGELTETIEAYETRADDEAKFVYALDKIMPIMLVYLHDGYSWKVDNITAKMLYDAKIKKVALSPEISHYFKQLNTLLLEHPEIIRSH
jgi:5'-deoxynucleotidase YfbR-like HD superfamily hydrolase